MTERQTFRQRLRERAEPSRNVRRRYTGGRWAPWEGGAEPSPVDRAVRPPSPDDVWRTAPSGFSVTPEIDPELASPPIAGTWSDFADAIRNNPAPELDAVRERMRQEQIRRRLMQLMGR